MSRNRLAFYPYVLVRVSCQHCVRRGSLSKYRFTPFTGVASERMDISVSMAYLRISILSLPPLAPACSAMLHHFRH